MKDNLLLEIGEPGRYMKCWILGLSKALKWLAKFHKSRSILYVWLKK